MSKLITCRVAETIPANESQCCPASAAGVHCKWIANVGTCVVKYVDFLPTCGHDVTLLDKTKVFDFDRPLKTVSWTF